MEHGNLQMHLHPYGSLPTDILNFEHKVQWVDHQPCKHKATGLIPSIVIGELKATTDVTERKDVPSWDYDDKESCWKWKRPPPLSRKTKDTRNSEDRKRAWQAKKKAENLSGRDSLLKAACGHNFCKSCLEGAFSGQTFVRERTCAGRKNLRAQKKNIVKCLTRFA